MIEHIVEVEFRGTMQTVRLEVRTKPEWVGVQAHLLGAAMWCVGVFWAEAYRRFLEDFTTVVGDVVYVSVSKTDAPAATLRHEAVHICQRKDEGAWLHGARYMLSAKWRLRYEIEAYAEDLRSGRSIENVTQALTKPAGYILGMDAGEVRPLVEAEARRVANEDQG